MYEVSLKFFTAGRERRVGGQEIISLDFPNSVVEKV